MKTLKDYEKVINKCSKCGLCQSVCPVYQQTGNECAVSRGKFIMLEGVLRGDLKLSKNINKYLDLCLKCGKCKEYCPSGIDVCEIFEVAKYEYCKKNIKSRIIWLLESKFVFNNLIKVLGRVQKLLNSDKKKPFFNKQKSVQNKICSEVTPVKQTCSPLKLLYFKGCVNKAYPKVESALKKVLTNYDVELIEKDFECCGVPFLSSGNLERFEQAKQYNLKLMVDDYDYILTDCASCEDTIRGYGVNKVINIADFISQYPKKFIFKKKVKVTFHKPCHLKNTDFLRTILDMCQNVEYVEMKDYDACCGFAGEFVLKNNKLSRAIGIEKAKNIMQTGADYVLSLCPACNLGLHQGFVANNNFKHPKIKNLVEFLALADEII